MDIEAEEVLGNNDVEDVSWLCSLSESELDMLISLKKLVLQRAKIIGHDVLAKKFNLKVLRALGFILMEYLRGQINDMPDFPDLVNSLLDGSNLLNSNFKGNMSSEELKAFICIKSRKRRLERVLNNLFQAFEESKRPNPNLGTQQEVAPRQKKWSSDNR